MNPIHRHSMLALSLALLASSVACSGDATAPSFTDLTGGTTPPPAAAPVATVSLSPTYRASSPGEQVAFKASLFDAQGRSVTGASVSWVSADPSLVKVDQAGNVSPQQEGVARVVANAGQAVDTAIVAVLGSQDLLVSALPEGSVKISKAAGQEVSVPVSLDLSRVSPTGDLGSVQFDVTYDPRVLEYVSSAVNVSGAAAANLVEPGRVRFAFAGADPQGQSLVKLLTLSLRVKSGAPAGAYSSLTVTFAGLPTSTGFKSYRSPLTVAGTVLVANR